MSQWNKMVSTSQKIAVTVSASRKKLSSKVTVFIREKYPSPIAGMKDSFKNKYPLDRKKSFLRQESLKKKYKKWFVPARNPFSLPGMTHSLKNSIQKNCFLWQENQRKWFPLAGKYFCFKIGST